MDPDIDLALVGHGSQLPALARVSRNLHLEHRVKFVGMVTHQNLATFYQAADFLVISSHSEGWPTVIFEALACGLPVIAHGVGGIPEVISSSDFGLIMNNNDNRTIAKAISSAFERVWNRCVAVNYASQHSWNEIADQYLRVYNESSI